MQEFKYVIKDELGIHARPAGLLVKEAKKYESNIQLSKGDKTVVITKLLMLMGLGVKKGEEITITVEGADEVQAVEAMKAFFEENL